jgi:rhamnosyltransferase subunit B
MRKDCALLNVLLIALGSSGDVLPFVGLGRALRARGHRVTLLANSHFESLIRESELDFVELGTEADYQSITENSSLWKPVPGVRLIADGLILRNMRRTLEIVEQTNIPGQTVIAAPLTAFGARIAQERHGIPLVTVCLQPSALRSATEPPVIRPMPLSRRLPRAWNRFIFALSDRAYFDPLVRSDTNALRLELGLRPIHRGFIDWSLSPTRVIGLFPDWFAPQASDWPSCARLCQFPLYDASDTTPLSSEETAFLDAGEPPVVVTPGSAMQHASLFLAAGIEACRIIGARGVLISPFLDQFPRELPPHIHVIDSIPFSRVFTRAAAIVHHGGIGTSSQALLAAIPQVIMPMAFDQHDNADRLERLGVARSVPPWRFRGKTVAKALGELLRSPSVAASCKTASDRMRSANPFGDACHWIEQAAVGAD